MRWAVPVLVGLAACNKVPLIPVDAGFVLADAAWFSQEQTMFVFYEVHAEQGLGDPSVVEIRYTTDTERVDWTPITEMVTVHEHVPVDCGPYALCGSSSLYIPDRPRDVELRLRYHRDGELALGARTVFNAVVGPEPHTHRSMVVYGVFDEVNERVQWRGRHQFPTVRNERASELGLRRQFWVEDQRYGSGDFDARGNPYGYAVPCPDDFEPFEHPRVVTRERARFNGLPLPVEAGPAAHVCARATVTDATGTFTSTALARKNPQVRPAFPSLRSPIRDAVPVKFFLAPCDRLISSNHEEMQRQRLDMDNVPTTCIDDWSRPGFADVLTVLFTDAIEDQRRAGDDMVLVIGLHQDEVGVADVVEDALAAIVPEERHRSSPRLAGAYVFDSDIRGLQLPELKPVTLWCPAAIPLDGLPDASARTCAIAPDNPDFDLGPFTFGTLPILPSREQYLEFIDTYSKRQAGKVNDLTYLTPEFSATADHVDLGEFGVVTFLDEEFIDADGGDAFSYCVEEDEALVVVRSELMTSAEAQQIDPEDCIDAGLPPDICAVADLGLLPLEFLPTWHEIFGERSYELGVFWDFPFLLRMEYRAVAAGAVGAFGLTVPFGVASDTESFLGTPIWTSDEIVLKNRLTQCDRFCGHPTFDSAGVYHITSPFRSTYANSCYLPDYPEPSDGGFPRDP